MKLYYYITSLFCLVTMLYLANIEDTNLAQIVEFGVLTIVNLILGVHYSLLEKIDSLNNNHQK
jgi:hypothetical protein